jgi:outer membrane protein assembly factor BamE
MPQPVRLPLLACAALLGAVTAATGGCVYRINVSQGNFLEAKAVDQVAVGMTRSQVRFLLGTPMLADSFHPDRWDYLYYFKEGRRQKVERRLLTVYFSDEKVARIERPAGEFKDPKLPSSPGA